jgi:anti-sigma regulatory factor (Ser/Thr protein kinase)
MCNADRATAAPRIDVSSLSGRGRAEQVHERAKLLEPYLLEREPSLSIAVFPPAPAACRSARELVREVLADVGDRRSTYAAELVASELAGNAVRHARSTFELRLSLREGAVRIAVMDEMPVPIESWKPPVAGDHGLGIVAALATEWGYEVLEGGKLVWADIPCEGED